MHTSRPSSASGFRPSTSSQLSTPNLKLQAAIEKYGSLANAISAISSSELSNKLVELWPAFYDRCRYLDSRISPSGNLSWTEIKNVFSYLHIHKMATERCLRNLFSDLGNFVFMGYFAWLIFTQVSHLRTQTMLFK
jgi:hypothetical protein